MVYRKYELSVPRTTLPITGREWDALVGVDALTDIKQMKIANRALIEEEGQDYVDLFRGLTHATCVHHRIEIDKTKQAELLHAKILELGMREVPLHVIYTKLETMLGKASRGRRIRETRVLISNGSGASAADDNDE